MAPDPTLRRLAPGLYAIAMGALFGWVVVRALLPDASPEQRSLPLVTTTVVAVLFAVLLDASLEPVARRLGLPRSWVVPAFVAALLLSFSTPLVLAGLHLFAYDLAFAAALWGVAALTVVVYLLVGLVYGRLLQTR